MAKELTSGFDVVAHVSEATIEEIFRSYYWLGNFPNYVSKPFTWDGQDHTVEVFFSLPTLRFVSKPGVENAVRLGFAYLVRLTNHDWEDEGEASVVLSALPVAPFEEGGAPVTALFLDFKSVGLGDWVFPAPGYPEFDQLVRPLIASSLIGTNKSLLITPPATLSPDRLTWKVYEDAGGRYFAAVFVNFATPAQDPPPTAKSFLDGGKGVRIALPVENVDKLIADGLAAMGLDHFPATLKVGDDEYTVDALKLKLKNHYLDIKGEVDDVEFHAKADLYASDDGLHPKVGWYEIDLPWYEDILNALTGGVIQKAVEEALPDALENAGSGALGGLGIFSAAVPGVALLVEVHNGGWVKTNANGLLIGASVTPTLDQGPVEVKEPTYIKGNRNTKEFHRPGCIYGQKLHWQKTVRFIREAAAIRAGYNGCFTCAREFSHPQASVRFGFQAEGNPASQQLELDIGIEGAVVEPVVIDGVDVEVPPVSVAHNLTVTTTGAGTWQGSPQGLELAPGVWKFRAHLGQWTGECTHEIWRTPLYGPANYIAFTVGKPEGKFGYGKMPSFP